ncbi:MAG: hypothetical protein IPI87_17720 [Betaproteobacteria bacterium]|nr:hypothetical protein [Betaproteobacteria bacterium]
MAPLKGIAVWYSAAAAGIALRLDHGRRRRRGAGRDAPGRVRAALQSGWRTLFVVFGVVTLVGGGGDRVAACRTCRASRSRRRSPGQWEGVRRVFAEPRFWWIVAVGAVGMGSFMAIQGLWSVPWMMEVEGARAPRRRACCWRWAC